MAIESELSEIILSELPVSSRYMKAESNEIGIVNTMIKVARQRPKKSRTMNITTQKVIAIVELRLLIERTMKSL